MPILSELADVRTGFSFRSRLEPDANGDTAVIQMRDLDEVLPQAFDRLTKISMPEYSSKHEIRKGDLLFRSRGTTTAATLVARDMGRAVLAAPMMVIRANPSRVEPRFLQWFLNQPSTQRLLAGKAAGTAVQMISKGSLEELEIPVPSLGTQRQIVQMAELAEKEERLALAIVNRRRSLLDSVLLRYSTEKH